MIASYFQPAQTLTSGQNQPAGITSGLIGSGAVTGSLGGGASDVASGTIGTYDLGSGAIVRAAEFTMPSASGTAWTLKTQETISGIRAVNISQSGTLQVAMCGVANSGRMPAIGVVIDNVLSGIVANVYTFGQLQFPMVAGSSGNVDFSGYLGRSAWVGRSGQVVSQSGQFNSGGLLLTSGNDLVQRLGTIFNSGGVILNVSPTLGWPQLLGTTAVDDPINTGYGI